MAGFEDEELSISLAHSANRRAQNKPADASSHRNAGPSTSASQNHAVARIRDKGENRVGAYQVIRTLGEGSFGKVKLALHKASDTEVALKIIARRKLISRDMAGRVEREIEYLQLLRHPHIIKLYVGIFWFMTSYSCANADQIYPPGIPSSKPTLKS